MTTRRTIARSAPRQRGAIAIMTAILLPLMILAAALAIDIGHLFFVKRDMQKAADLAAVAAAQFPANAQAVAEQVAAANGFIKGGTNKGAIRATVGNWNPATNAGVCPPWNANCVAPSYFSAAGFQDAAQVEMTEDVPYLFVFGSRVIKVGAVAWNTNSAGFSLGSQVLGLQNGLLNAILGGLLNTTLNLGVVGYNSLLGATVNIGKLQQALHVGTVNELLNAKLDLPGLYQGVLTALNNQGGLVSSQASGVLGQILGSGIHVPLDVRLGDILNLSAPSDSAAAAANVNVFNLITAAAMVANGKHFIQIPNLGVNLPGLVNLSLGLNVISPPSYAFGPPGQRADGTWRTQAHTAQVALGLDLTIGQLLGGLVHIPIYLEVAPAQAHLTSLVCASPQTGNQTTIGANTGLLTAIIGDVPPNALNNTTDPLALQKNVQPATLLNVLGLIKVTMAPLILPLSANGFNPNVPGSVNYADHVFVGKPSQAWTINTNAAGSALGTLLNALAYQLQNNPQSLTVSLIGINLGLGQIVGDLLALLNPILQPVTQLLDGLLVPVLNLLGIQLGAATVNYNAVLCNNAVLVY